MIETKPKHPGGRPTLLTSELIERAKGYLATCIDDLENKEARLPSIASLAVWLKVSRDSIYEWAKHSKEFSDILDDILAEQEKRLIDKGIGGAYNPQIAKLVLGKHGYSDKQELTGKNGEPIMQSPFLNPKLQEALKPYEDKLIEVITETVATEESDGHSD